MDPDACWLEIVELGAVVENIRESDEARLFAAVEMGERVAALYEWLAGGGFAPKAFAPKAFAPKADVKADDPSLRPHRGMGRGAVPFSDGAKVRLRRVRLDSQGYDRGTAYWGLGEPLWVAWSDAGGEMYVRAPAREAAKTLVRAHVQGARFFR